MEETGLPGENHWPATSHFIEYTSPYSSIGSPRYYNSANESHFTCDFVWICVAITMLIVCLDRDYVQLRIKIVTMGVYSFL